MNENVKLFILKGDLLKIPLSSHQMEDPIELKMINSIRNHVQFESSYTSENEELDINIALSHISTVLTSINTVLLSIDNTLSVLEANSANIVSTTTKTRLNDASKHNERQEANEPFAETITETSNIQGRMQTRYLIISELLIYLIRTKAI